MPEGDTIYRTAAALRATLLGHPTTGFETTRVIIGVRPQLGAVVERVDSHGKHLEIGWDDGTVLHTHLRMSGSWHLYRVGERWRKPTNEARVVITTDTFEAVCFNAPIVETYRTHDYFWHPGLGRLGPDLCEPNVDIADCVRRMDSFCALETTVADVLLDQRIACGVGNVWKSETLWMCSVHPDTPVGALMPEQKAFLIETASKLLRANLDHIERITTPEIGGLAVYGRFRRRCYRCNETIAIARHGEHARVTYWCPGCQLYLAIPDVEVAAVVDPGRRATRWFGPASLPSNTAELPAVPRGPDVSNLGEVDTELYREPKFDTHPAALVVAPPPRGVEPRYIDPILARRAGFS
jgi:endonuclease-8